MLYYKNINQAEVIQFIQLLRKIQARSGEAILQELGIQYRLSKAKVMIVQVGMILDLDLTLNLANIIRLTFLNLVQIKTFQICQPYIVHQGSNKIKYQLVPVLLLLIKTQAHLAP